MILKRFPFVHLFSAILQIVGVIIMAGAVVCGAAFIIAGLTVSPDPNSLTDPLQTGLQTILVGLEVFTAGSVAGAIVFGIGAGLHVLAEIAYHMKEERS